MVSKRQFGENAASLNDKRNICSALTSFYFTSSFQMANRIVTIYWRSPAYNLSRMVGAILLRMPPPPASIILFYLLIGTIPSDSISFGKRFYSNSIRNDFVGG